MSKIVIVTVIIMTILTISVVANSEYQKNTIRRYKTLFHTFDFDFGLDHPVPGGRYIYICDLDLQVEGRLKYLHRSPASRKRRRKGNPVPGGITGPPCSWGI
jgi:hypothetical protein